MGKMETRIRINGKDVNEINPEDIKKAITSEFEYFTVEEVKIERKEFRISNPLSKMFSIFKNKKH